MLGLGFWEIVIIGLVALIVVGPDKLPEFAKSVAKFLNEMKRTASDLKSAMDDEKDIFKDEIDKLQKLSNDIKNFPEDNNLSLNSHGESKTDVDSPNHEELENQSHVLNHEELEDQHYGLHHDDLSGAEVFEEDKQQLELLTDDQELTNHDESKKNKSEG